MLGQTVLIHQNPKTLLNEVNHSQIYLQYLNTPIIQNNHIFRHHSRVLQDKQTRSAILSQQHFTKLKKIMLGIKVKIIRDIFIKKIKKNHKFKQFQDKKNLQIEHLCQIKGIQFSEKIQHFSIAINLLAIIVLLVLASFSATLDQFSTNLSTIFIIYFIKFICLAAIFFRILVNALGHTFKNGQYLTYVSQIMSSYMSTTTAYIDISSFILLIFFIIFPQSRALSCAIFLFLIVVYMRGASDIINLQAAYIRTRKTNLLWSLLKILVFNFILAHIVATTLMGISHFDEQKSWLVKYGIDGSKWYVYYAISYYWGAIIVTTVGFGDISCGNWKQAIVVSILVIFTSMILGYNITQFNNIFSQYRASSHKVSHNNVIFKRMITRDDNNNASIDPVLKKQIYRYIDDQGLDKGDLQFSERNQFIQGLPEYLRKSYLRAANKRIFISVLFFNQLKHQTLALLTQAFSNHYLYPEEQIADPTNTINILQEGKVALTYKRPGSTINGMIFDSIKVQKKQNLLLLNSDFINLHKQTHYGLYGKNYCLIWGISVQNFINVLSGDIMDFEYYYSLLHKHPLDDDQWQTIICSRCSNNSSSIVHHNAYCCPQICLIPNRNLVVHRHLLQPQIGNNNYGQKRLPYRRIKQKMFRISVLKYYKNYFQALVRQKSKIETQQNYLINFFPRRNVGITKNFQFFIDTVENRFYDQKNMVLMTDLIQNFQYYYPTFNACNLKAQQIDISRKRDFAKKLTMKRFHPSSTNAIQHLK